MRSPTMAAGLVLAVAATTAPTRAERAISAEAYYDKLRGMWLGQLIGLFTGLPTEGVYSGSEPNPNPSVPWALLQVWTTDDDTDLEYLIQHVYLTHGSEPTPAQLRDEWLAHVPVDTVWIANRQARYWMGYGLLPPETGSYQRNVNWYAIDPQLTTESIGAIAPGLRQWAIGHTARWARITTDGHPVHAAQFYAAMYAAATFEGNVRRLIDRGLEAVPKSSRTSAVVRDVLAWYEADRRDGELDWRATRRKLYDHYQGDQSFGRHRVWIESTINVGATTLALLYGNGAFEDTVQIAVLAGWDCDCNGATSGGLLGMIYGYKGLPPDLVGQCGDTYRNTRRPDLPRPGPLPQDDSIIAIGRRWQGLAEDVIVGNGGYITGSGGDRMYHLPDADPVVPEPELWDPNEAAGLVGELRRKGEPVTVAASIARFNPQLDRDDLEGIADGVVDTRYNGHQAYWTRDNDPQQPAGGDYYQLSFPRQVRVDRVIFYEGDLVFAAFNEDPLATAYPGGYFTTLTVETRRAGAWSVPPELHQNEPLDKFRPFQIIAFDFASRWCAAVRVRGTAGGTEQFTTILELEAYGYGAPPGVKGDLSGDGQVNNFDIDPFVLALTDIEAYIKQYPRMNPYDSGDINGDGELNNFDIDPFVKLLTP